MQQELLITSVGFTGTQHGMSENQQSAVRSILTNLKPTQTHHGDCVGSDDQFHSICEELKTFIIIHPPKIRDKRAFCGIDYPLLEIRVPKNYLVRNKDIVLEAKILLATPKERVGEVLRSGTWSTVRYARKLGRRVIIIRPDGAIEDTQPTGEKRG